MNVELGSPFFWRPGAQTELTEDHLQYNNSWGWLMPVIDKIEMLQDGKHMLNYDYDSRPEFIGFTCTWFTMLPKDQILRSLDTQRFDTKIEAAYNAVVEFILHDKNDK